MRAFTTVALNNKEIFSERVGRRVSNNNEIHHINIARAQPRNEAHFTKSGY